MSTIARGWEKRLDIVNVSSSSDSESTEQLIDGIKVEIENDAILKEKVFEDTKLQKLVLEYLNALDDQLDAVHSTDILTSNVKFNDALNVRSSLLKTFVNDYNFKVNRKYEQDLKEMLKTGDKADEAKKQKEALTQLLTNIKWDTQKLYDTHYEYTAVVENTSDYSYNNISLVYAIYDSSDIKTETYGSINSWAKGEKIKLDFGSEVEASRIDTTAEYYEIAE